MDLLKRFALESEILCSTVEVGKEIFVDVNGLWLAEESSESVGVFLVDEIGDTFHCCRTSKTGDLVRLVEPHSAKMR